MVLRGSCSVSPLVACEKQPPLPAGVAGDPERGKLLLRQYGCGSCHSIPGVAAARGNVGPPLEAIGARVYLAGRAAEHAAEHGEMDTRAAGDRSAHRDAQPAGA